LESKNADSELWIEHILQPIGDVNSVSQVGHEQKLCTIEGWLRLHLFLVFSVFLWQIRKRHSTNNGTVGMAKQISSWWYLKGPYRPLT